MRRSSTATATILTFTTAIDIELSLGSPSVNFPPRVVLALVVAFVFAALAAWALVRLPYLRGLALTASQRRLLALVVAAFFALLSAWVVFVLPAYWD
jgi:hypothetical protein